MPGPSGPSLGRGGAGIPCLTPLSWPKAQFPRVGGAGVREWGLRPGQEALGGHLSQQAAQSTERVQTNTGPPLAHTAPRLAWKL